MNLMRTLTVLAFSLLSLSAHAWELRQVRIKHVQVEKGSLYISVNASTAAVSGCTSTNYDGWLRMEMSNPNVAGITKEITAFALAAHLSQTLVDIGSTATGCVANYANLSFIRVGDYAG